MQEMDVEEQAWMEKSPLQVKRCIHLEPQTVSPRFNSVLL